MKSLSLNSSFRVFLLNKYVCLLLLSLNVKCASSFTSNRLESKSIWRHDHTNDSDVTRQKTRPVTDIEMTQSPINQNAKRLFISLEINQSRNSIQIEIDCFKFKTFVIHFVNVHFCRRYKQRFISKNLLHWHLRHCFLWTKKWFSVNNFTFAEKSKAVFCSSLFTNWKTSVSASILFCRSHEKVSMSILCRLSLRALLFNWKSFE